MRAFLFACAVLAHLDLLVIGTLVVLAFTGAAAVVFGG